MSEHKVSVVRLGPIEKHPNADTLGVVRVWGYTAITRLGDFNEGDLAVYVEPDYVLPDRPEYAFLGGKLRIKAKRLRGTWSQGLLLKPAPGMSEGDDVMTVLGIEHYEPPLHLGTDGDAERPHESLASLPKYDVESWRRYGSILVPGERVIVTEKIHGANARYAFRDGRMWCGSRTQWKREEESSIWWRALRAAPWIGAWCASNPTSVLYGEVFGQVQDLRYDSKPSDPPRFAAFDMMTGNTWVDACDLLRDEGPAAGTVRVPIVYDGPYDPATIEEMSRGDSRIAKHLAEGIVIKPARERTHEEIGRVALKLVSDRYLERS